MSSVRSEGELSLGCDVTQNQLSLKCHVKSLFLVFNTNCTPGEKQAGMCVKMTTDEIQKAVWAWSGLRS